MSLPDSPHRPTVLILGGGGREHALARAVSLDSRDPQILCAPGNAGTSRFGANVPLSVTDVEAVLGLCRERSVDLVLVGPEAPLVVGVADRLRKAGVPVVGPSAAAARLEGSKAFANEVMDRHGIPTAPSRAFTREEQSSAEAYVQQHALPVVLKADGLAGGKGVVIAESHEEAIATLREMFSGEAFGGAGATVVVESFMHGEEASVFVLTDGTDAVLLPPAQDHKRIGEGDTGLNTGGMGAYVPAPIVTPGRLARVRTEIVEPLLGGLRAEGTPYRGVLYCGLMMTAVGPRVVEFNCRFGDPEAQVLLPLFGDATLEVMEAIAHGRVGSLQVTPRAGAAACVVLASAGYPESYETGFPITGLKEAEAMEYVLVDHAGTRRDGDRMVTDGGRVLGVTGLGDTLEEALKRAYAAADRIQFEGKTLRRDIGRKGLRHLDGG